MTSSMVKRELVSVVIPVFNEEDGVGQLRDKLLRLRDLLSDSFDLELIFVDDGSHDNTVAVLNHQFEHQDIPFCVLEHIVNRGVGAAFRTGFHSARGAYICTIDADCSYTPEGLEFLLATLLKTGHDIAVASPYHPDGGVEGVPGWRLVLSKTCSLLYRVFSPLKLYTYTSIFRVYRAEVLRRVPFNSDGFVAAVEILIGAGRCGYSVVEVPMILRARAVGRSKMKLARTTVSHLRMLVSFAALAPLQMEKARSSATVLAERKTENVV